MSISRSLLFTGTLLVCTGYSHAVITGMDTKPLGERDSSGVQYAYWDRFTQTLENPPEGTTYTFKGEADSGSTLSSVSLVQTTPHAIGSQGSGLLNQGDVYYSSTFAQNWLLTGTASIDVSAISFQIKTANVGSVIDQLFTPTLNGVGPGTFHISTAVEGETIFNFPAYVIEYRWEGLEIAANEQLEIEFAMAGGNSGAFTRKPVDFVSVDVATVPEPSTGLLVGAAALLLPNLRRRRRTA
jgi:hypothetical protein